VDMENSPGFGMLLVNTMALQLSATASLDRSDGTRFSLEFKM